MESILNLALVLIGLTCLVLTPAISRLNARAFPFPSYRISYVAGLAAGVTISIVLIALGLRGLILNCPPFPIEQMPAHCHW
jgi:uncharacterized membrane protein